MKRVDGVEESRPDVYRGAYISRERKRGSGDPLSLSLASFSFSFSVSISNHFFQPSPPCDLPFPSLVHPLLSLREAMLRYDLFRREVLIGLADFKNCRDIENEDWLVIQPFNPRIV